MCVCVGRRGRWEKEGEREGGKGKKRGEERTEGEGGHPESSLRTQLLLCEHIPQV